MRYSARASTRCSSGWPPARRSSTTRASGSAGGRASPTTTTGSCGGRAAKNLERALADGLDPLQVVIDRAHEKDIQIVCSLRINEGGTGSGQNQNRYMFSRLKEQHPEYMIRRRLHRPRQVHVPELRNSRGQAGTTHDHRGGLQPLRRGRHRDRRLRADVLPPVGNREEHSPAH